MIQHCMLPAPLPWRGKVIFCISIICTLLLIPFYLSCPFFHSLYAVGFGLCWGGGFFWRVLLLGGFLCCFGLDFLFLHFWMCFFVLFIWLIDCLFWVFGWLGFLVLFGGFFLIWAPLWAPCLAKIVSWHIFLFSWESGQILLVSGMVSSIQAIFGWTHPCEGFFVVVVKESCIWDCTEVKIQWGNS